MAAVILWGALLFAGVFGWFVGDTQTRGSILFIAIGIALFAAVHAIQRGYDRIYRRRKRRVYVCQECDYVTGSAWGAEAHHRRYNHMLEG